MEALENKLVHILENVDGVGKAEVMITLKSSKESVLNKDLSEAVSYTHLDVYKRQVTEKSLEQERQNLERVTDILAELEKQVGPLEKQSAKAKEYLKLRDEEKDIDIHLFLYDYERLKKEQEENERDVYKRQLRHRRVEQVRK